MPGVSKNIIKLLFLIVFNPFATIIETKFRRLSFPKKLLAISKNLDSLSIEINEESLSIPSSIHDVDSPVPLQVQEMNLKEMQPDDNYNYLRMEY